MNNFTDSVAFHIAAFGTGFVFGSFVFAYEIVFFIGDMFVNAVFHILPATPASNSVFSSYTTGIEIITIVGIIQGILIGFLLIESFSFGYLLGDLVLILLLGNYLWGLAPSVVIGMVIAFVAVLFGIGVRILIKNRRNKYERNYYW